MELLLLIGLLVPLCFLLRLPIALTTFGTVLLIPFLAHLLGTYLTFSAATYWATIGLLLGSMYFMRGDLRSAPTPQTDTSWVYVALFAFLYSTFYLVTSTLWPDFIAIGERLRDYALLGSLIHQPGAAQEPWMAGAGLNYYAYWYRLGSAFAGLFQLETWQVYHRLGAFCYAFYFTVIFWFVREQFQFSKTAATLTMLLVGAGSNISGVRNAMTSDANWWGPSRVIQGAINEFPVWSFVLGDLHPHFLNLGLLPFFLLLITYFATTSRPLAPRVVLVALTATFSLLWVCTSNLWDVPVLLLSYALLLVGVFLFRRNGSLCWSVLPRASDFFQFETLLFVLSFAILALAPIGWLLSFSADGGEVAMVRNPILQTTVKELFAHWGLPLVALSIGVFAGLRNRAYAWMGVTALLSSLFLQDAVTFLWILLLLVGSWIVEQRGTPVSRAKLFTGACAVVGLVCLLVPEIIFLNDSYGGENERMNTIFKLYSVNWFFLHLGALSLLGSWGHKIYSGFKAESAPPSSEPTGLLDCPHRLLQHGSVVLGGSLVVLFCSFGFQAAGLRIQKQVPATERGLKTVEKEFRGSEVIIEHLSKAPRGTVLEAQGGPYSYTSFVCTLSSQPCYLGWANHIGLLTKQYAEIERRTKFTEMLYRASTCPEIQYALVAEDIRYVIVGTLEKRAFPNLRIETFSCLRKVVEAGDYAVFTPR